VKENKKAAAYIRFSEITFPAHCQEKEARSAFLLELAVSRRTELTQMAALHEQRIEAWYEDLGCSGRGRFLASRVQFEALTQAARHGELGSIFAWDLSRLFRDLVQQELWLEEMETLDVAVLIQDLPFAIDAATRRLLRQELGMINEYQAARIGALFSAALNARVAEGLWVGRTHSQWGLRYDAEGKGFLLDETTAPRIRRLYALFNAFGGSASRTVRTLNRELEANHPDALPPPRSRRWTVASLIKQIRDPL
jgi:DNA invertase Pin-like site-specific DNA recombinase